MPAIYTNAEPWVGRDDPEDGADAVRMHHLARSVGDRAVIGFACDAGVARNKGRVGAVEGPVALRKALANMAASTNPRPFVDLGDVCVSDGDLEAGQDLLAEKLGEALPNYDRVIVLGGGHETAYSSYLALHHHAPSARIGIINLDAHLDLRALGPAGPSSGTPFTQIRDLASERFDYLCIGYAEEANTQAMLNRARHWGVGLVEDRVLQMDDHASHAAIDAMAERSEIIYLTIDLDILPHYQAPGVSAPAARGVRFDVVEAIIDQVLLCCAKHNCALPLTDLVELSPRFDRDGVTAKTAAALARRLLIS